MAEKPGRSWPTESQRVAHNQSDPVRIGTRLFLSVATLPQGGLSVKAAQLLGLRAPWQHQVCRDVDCLCGRSYGPIRVFFQASCIWRSEGLFSLWPVFLHNSTHLDT